MSYIGSSYGVGHLYRYRPSMFGARARARYAASRRRPYNRRYGAFGAASRSRARRVPYQGRRIVAGYKRALYRAPAYPEVKNYDNTAQGYPMGVFFVTSSGATTGSFLVDLSQGCPNQSHHRCCPHRFGSRHRQESARWPRDHCEVHSHQGHCGLCPHHCR